MLKIGGIVKITLNVLYIQRLLNFRKTLKCVSNQTLLILYFKSDEIHESEEVRTKKYDSN